MTAPVMPSTMEVDREAYLWVLRPEEQPDIASMITENDDPVDCIATEKQQRLLAGSLNDSWAGPGNGRPFIVMTNVGYFHLAKQPAVVPDCLLSLDPGRPSQPGGPIVLPVDLRQAARRGDRDRLG